MLGRIAVVLGAVMIPVAVAVSWPASARGSFDRKACTFNGKKLYGKIQEVKSGADVRVQVVKSFGDLKVQKVSSFASHCGQWQMVDAFGNTKVQFVSSFGDVKIQYVSSFPGVR
ncbi:MAG TPA: hypothetical protein VF469_17365 [Kofleriaceae bacterium]